MHSLPLMGIGNLKRRLFVELDVVLITPHGDRKQCRTLMEAESLKVFPHYPSWGSETLAPA